MLKFQIFDELELRPFHEENAEEIFETVKANYEHLRPFLHWVTKDYSLESAKEFIRQTQKNFTENTSQTFGIFYSKKFVGAIGFVNFNWTSRRAEIGYWIAKDSEGKGIITKSCARLIDYAFHELKMNRVEIRCATENTRTCAVPERLNFKLEGILRQSVWRHARFYDMAIYGILAEERENI
ncbi:MAG: GNAT family N-acetyltransferase [Pyrinomonadaceae bacterium]